MPRSLEQVGEQSFRQAPSAQDTAGDFLPRRCQAPSAVAPLNEPLPFQFRQSAVCQRRFQLGQVRRMTAFVVSQPKQFQHMLRLSAQRHFGIPPSDDGGALLATMMVRHEQGGH